MIIGVYLRNFKIYKGINFIPLSDGDSFSALIGENGIGKSSVLEALDCFFNNKEWNYNLSVKKSGLETTAPYIVPIFCLPKHEFQDPILASISDFILNDTLLGDITSSNKQLLTQFQEHIQNLKRKINIINYYIIPLGVFYKNEDPCFGIFNSSPSFISHISNNHNIKTLNDLKQEDIYDVIKKSLNNIRSKYKYLYIPKELGPEQFTKLENHQIQTLMGKSLTDIIKSSISESTIERIGTQLRTYITNLSNDLDNYEYKKDGERQTLINKNNLYKLIIDDFFAIRKIHKKKDDKSLAIDVLSSGEKQKAIIDITYHLLHKNTESGKNLILALDEPESSLHMSACYDQFERLYNISRISHQLIITSHWYGFLPTIDKGAVTILGKKLSKSLSKKTNKDYDQNYLFYSLGNYREASRKQNLSDFSSDIRIKSINDLIQSIITSTLNESPYNWIICEGSSEKIYLSHYLKDLMKNNKLRIIPVGGANKVQQIYLQLSAVYNDIKHEMKGKVFLLSDTDPQYLRYDVNKYEHIRCERIVSNNEQIKLVKIQENPVSPETTIEDALEGHIFYKTLIDFKDPSLNFLSAMSPVKTKNSKHCLDLKMTEIEKIKLFFDKDNNKYDFAKRYIESDEDFDIPLWMKNIYDWFDQN